jgi:hypothetical protein
VWLRVSGRKGQEMSDVTQAGEAGPFVGESPEEGITDEKPNLQKAFERAAEKASRAGYAGHTFQIQLEMIPEAHNQWVKTYKVIASSDGSA